MKNQKKTTDDFNKEIKNYNKENIKDDEIY